MIETNDDFDPGARLFGGYSGWHVYDLAAHKARRAGMFETVEPWSSLWSNALAGQVRVKDLAEFNKKRAHFADCLREVVDRDMRGMAAAELEAVIKLCQLRCPGVSAARVTKLAALYRPRAVPILDSKVARYLRLAASTDVEWTAGLIDIAVRQIEEILRAHHADLAWIRNELRSSGVQGLSVMTEVRMLDIAIWTTQDDADVGATSSRDWTWLKGRTEPVDGDFDLESVPLG